MTNSKIRFAGLISEETKIIARGDVPTATVKLEFGITTKKHTQREVTHAFIEDVTEFARTWQPKLESVLEERGGRK